MLNRFSRSIRRYSILSIQIALVTLGFILLYLTDLWIADVALVLAALIGLLSAFNKSLDILRHGYYGIYALQITTIVCALFLGQPTVAALLGLVVMTEQPFIGRSMSSLFKAKHAPLVKALDVASLPFTVFIVIVAGTLWTITKDTDRLLAILAAGSTAPLLLAGPLVYMYRLKNLQSNQIRIRTVRILEQLAEAKAIILRKSGVLTEKQVTVSKIYSFGKNTKTHIMQIASALATESSHPLSQAILTHAADNQKTDKAKHNKIITGQGIIGRKKGTDLMMGRYAFLKDHGVSMPEQELSDSNVVAYVAESGKCIGAVVFTEQEMPGMRGLSKKLKKMGFDSVQIVSGSSKAATAAIAKAASISKSKGDILSADIIGLLQEDTNAPVVYVGSDEQDETIFPQADIGISTDPTAVSAAIMIDGYSLSKLVQLFGEARSAHKKASLLVVVTLLITFIFVLLSAAGMLTPVYASLVNLGITILVLISSTDLRGKERQR